jgi:hypothetical protein
MVTLRSAVLATAFAVTVAAAVTGASYRAETRETNLAETCLHETWPAISDRCLTGDVRATVRVVSADSVAPRAMRERFAAAFE